MKPLPWKVGDLSRESGVTVRTLHHYDEIGLLKPAFVTNAGHRMYGQAELQKLQQIRSLQQVGFSLDTIRDILREQRLSALQIVDMHLSTIREELNARNNLLEKLQRLHSQLQAMVDVTVADLLQLLEGMNMLEKYYTPEQLKQLEERKRLVGDDRIQEVQAEWQILISKVRAAMESDTDPRDETVQELAKQWKGLVAEFSGGDPGIEKAAKNFIQNEPQKMQQYENMPTPELFEYIGRAMK